MRANKNKNQPLSDKALLDRVQRYTLRYFWEFGHPVSGMARERSNPVPQYDSLKTVTTGGTGFGIMAMIAGAERGFIDRAALQKRLHKITDFLVRADKFHGAFPHFLHGRTGKVIPFSDMDNGGDLVETAFLIAGLLCARQYFKDDNGLCDKINALWHGVDWQWYARDNKSLYWHWSPSHGWGMDHTTSGWNEAIIAYVLAASSPTHPISKDIYEQGWVSGNDFENGKTYHDILLPLGPDFGGPLFFAHYSFLGLDPRGLKDKHADYWQQNVNHVKINRAHCLDNPHGHHGYGPDCWGLSASDGDKGYDTHSPKNDKGVIAPTAALSSMPYTPEESMKALRHFHDRLGDKIWGAFGFKDAFNHNADWVADGHLAIDQGPIVVMIENYRSGLLWDLFMSCPEVKSGLKKLDFQSPHLQGLKTTPSAKTSPKLA